MDYSIAIIAVLVFFAASTGAIFSPGAWYEGLKKPWFTPPNWMFPVVWTVLYIMIGIAGWLAWKTAGLTIPLFLWALQLAVNASWSAVFFGLKRIDLALIVVFFLLATIMAFILAIWPHSVWAGLLFVPYLLWVATATALNYSVWRLNREQSGT